MIESIYIKNIKGFGDPGKTLTLGLKANKYNICFAPNGFGKSSLAVALNLLVDSPRRIQSNKDIAHRNDESLPIEITIRIDGVDYTADAVRNDISSQLRCHVISSKVDVSTIQQNRGRYTHVEGTLDINDVEVYKKIPQQAEAPYRISRLKESFGRNGKILTNLSSVFENGRFLHKLLEPDVKNALDHIRRTVYIRRIIDHIKDESNTLGGTAASIRTELDARMDLFNDFNNLPDIQTLKQNLSEFRPRNASNYEWYDFLWQVITFWDVYRTQMNAVVRRLDYETYKDKLRQEISQLNSTWKSLNVVEKNGNLVVEFPNATQISNGQRDFLTFISDFARVRTELQLHPNKKHLVVVDEVLDYLDDANMLALQHYISQLPLKTNGNVYTCLLTHLSPQSFRSYIFSDGKVNKVFLDSSVPMATLPFLAFISFRSSLNKAIPEEQELYDKLSVHFFHYNPDADIDMREELTARRRDNLKTSWGQVPTFKQAIIDEVNAYLQGRDAYDPYAVCMGIRQKVEREVYMLLPNDQSKELFIRAHKTRDKFKIAEDNGISVPAHFNLITAIHNDADHVSWNTETLRYNEKTIVYSLQHPIIKNMIAQIFGYEEIDLSVDCIL
ncbi:MAG: hypothetical protein HDS38_07330 [Bacteroides sp.]|nr:hypothetical protein [Bacteroides sp.]